MEQSQVLIKPISLSSQNRKLVLPRETHGILLGQTGTGKSTLARRILSHTLNYSPKQSLIIDPKADFSPPGLSYRETDKPDRFIREIRRGNDAIYRPLPAYIEGETFEEVFEEIFWHGDLLVYIDELTMVSRSPTSYPIHERALYQQGRTRGIQVLGGSQRPSGIPLFCMSESGKFWVSHLMMEDDRKRANQFLGLREYQVPSDRHSFFVREQGEYSPREILLEIVS